MSRAQMVDTRTLAQVLSGIANGITRTVQKTANVVANEVRKRKEAFDNLTEEEKRFIKFGGPARLVLQNQGNLQDMAENHVLLPEPANMYQSMLPEIFESLFPRSLIPFLPELEPTIQQTDSTLISVPASRPDSLPKARPLDAEIPLVSAGEPEPLPEKESVFEVEQLVEVMAHYGIPVKEVQALPDPSHTVKITVDDLIAASKIREPEYVYARR